MVYAQHDVERLVPEAPKAGSTSRSAFERDRARVLHSAALRRLAAKTQVVGVGEDDFPRTRLTHSLECAQIGRELASALGADPDLVDAACLAHDLGHPPFGHNGETALDAAAADCGGFEGNAQSFRVLTRLEAKVPGAGLNLTRATLAATMKYPWPRREGLTKFGAYPDDMAVFDWVRSDVAGDRRCFEATVMDWADDVAYSVHDFEDGVVADMIDLELLRRAESCRRSVVELTAETYVEASHDEVGEALDRLLSAPWWPAAYDGSFDTQVALKRATSELIGRFCSASVAATRERFGPRALAGYGAELIVPRDIEVECAALKGVTAVLVMQRPEALARQAREREVIGTIVERTIEGAPDSLGGLGWRSTVQPSREEWARADTAGARLRAVIDHVAGLTDTSAWRLYARLTTP